VLKTKVHYTSVCWMGAAYVCQVGLPLKWIFTGIQTCMGLGLITTTTCHRWTVTQSFVFIIMLQTVYTLNYAYMSHIAVYHFCTNWYWIIGIEWGRIVQAEGANWGEKARHRPKYRKLSKTFSVVFGTEDLTITLILTKNYQKQVGCFW